MTDADYNQTPREYLGHPRNPYRSPAGRVLNCTQCHQNWHVTELPTPFLDPRRYVCGQCLQPAQQQLGLEENREETRVYDPAVAAMPEGF